MHTLKNKIDMDMSNNNNTPRLRFPGFTGEWEKKKLSEVTTDIYQPQTISKEQFTTSGYPVYGANGIIGYYDKFNHDTDQIAITCRGATCGTVNLTKGKCWITGNAMVVNIDKVSKNFDKNFICYLLSFCDLTSIITGSGQPQIVRTPLLNFAINLPQSLLEQKKIAECLSEMDNLISAQGQKVETLQEQKKGLMQQLFPQQGESTPRLRFPGFSGIWEEKKFGTICDFIRGPFGGALKKDEFVKNGYAIYEQQHAIYGQWKFRYYVDSEKFRQMKRFKVNPGDILMSCSGTMGKTVIVPDNCTPGIINQALLKLNVKDGGDNRFIKNFMDSHCFQERLIARTSGGAIQNVASVSILKEIEIPFPSLPEQQKIASCLSSLDDLIAAETAKFDTLKDHKKGLMQQLFPQTTK